MMARSIRVLIALAFLVVTPLSLAPDQGVAENSVCAAEGPEYGRCKFMPGEICFRGPEAVWDYYWIE
jgi:hypothetical protein